MSSNISGASRVSVASAGRVFLRGRGNVADNDQNRRHVDYGVILASTHAHTQHRL